MYSFQTFQDIKIELFLIKFLILLNIILKIMYFKKEQT